MSNKKPYKYWSLDYFFIFLKKQAIDYNISVDLVREIVYSDKWNPIEQYNGCNVVQDELHPFLPCFIHDYRWITGNGGTQSNFEFRMNLLKAGFSKPKAELYFWGVQLGWMLYFRWKKR